MNTLIKKDFKISARDAKKRLDSEKGIILVDVRSSEEYKENHINNSISIPLESLHEDIENEAPNKSTTIFVYCNSGNKSGKAAEMLDKLGYTNVYDLGGMVNWPYETIRGN